YGCENGLKEPQPSPDSPSWSPPITRPRSALGPSSRSPSPPPRFEAEGVFPRRQNRSAPSPSRPRRGNVSRVGNLIVSLCFADGLRSHDDALGVLCDYGLCGTFYVSSGSISTESHLDWDQLLQIQRAGNEIG